MYIKIELINKIIKIWILKIVITLGFKFFSPSKLLVLINTELSLLLELNIIISAGNSSSLLISKISPTLISFQDSFSNLHY